MRVLTASKRLSCGHTELEVKVVALGDAVAAVSGSMTVWCSYRAGGRGGGAG